MKKLFVFLFCSLVLLGGTFTSAHAITAQAPGSTGTDYAELYSQLQALQQQINDLQWRNNVNMSIVSPSQVGDQAVVLNENGIITLIAPDGNTRKPGSSLFTRWTTSGFTGGEKTLSVYKMNTLVETISKSIPATANSYSWTIPSNFETGNYRAVLKDNATGVTSAVDEGLFTVDTTIVPPTPTPAPTPAQPTGKSLSLISPDGNSYTVGSGATIYTKWTSLGLSGNIGLSLYRGTTLIQKISGSVPVTQKTYSWKLPGNLGAGDYRVVIKDDITGTTSSGDEGLFTIIPSDPLPTPKITVLSPKGGEKYKIGNTVAIKWGAKNLPVSAGNKVSLSLLRYENGGPVGDVSINNEIANTGSYSFQIRDSIKAGLYKVRVSLPCGSTSIGTGVSDGWCGTYDESDSTFEIMANSYTGTPVKVTYPNGKEKLEIGKTYTIRWTARSFKTTADVQLGIIDTRYSSEAGDRSEKTIVNTKNTGSYKWTIPSNIGTMDFSDTSDPVYRIKLYVGNQETNDFDQSDNTFSIIDKRANNVKVSLSKDTPKSRDVKLGEQNAEFLRFDIANKGKEDIAVTGIKLNGALHSSDLSNLYVYDGSTRVGSEIPTGVDLRLDILFPTPVIVTQNSLKAFAVKADISTDSGVVGDRVTLSVEKLYFKIGEKSFEMNVNNVRGKKMTIVSGDVTSPMTPGTPTNVSATATGQTTASLSWTRNSPFTDLWWEVSGAGNVGGAGATSGTISGLTCGTKYLFNLRAAVTSNGKTYYSSYVQSNYVTTDPCSLSTLSTPTGLTATVGGKNVVLTWNAVSGATAYNVYRDLPTVSRTSARYLDWANGIATYTDASICSGKTGEISYLYYVDAYAGTSASGATQRSARSQGVSATVDCGSTPNDPISPPSTPTGFSATMTTLDAINLSWNAANGATSYAISCSGSCITPISTSETKYTVVKGFACGNTYTFFLIAKNAVGESRTKTSASVTAPTCGSNPTVLSAPTGFVATAVSPTSVKLIWNAVTGADGYNIYRDEKLVARERGKVFHYNEGLSVNTSYVYKVEAYKYDSNWNILASNNFSDSVTIKTNSVSPTTKVISPNGGETYKVGDTVSIKWTVTGMGNSNSVAVSVYKYRSDNNYYGVGPNFGVTWYNDYTSSGTLDSGSYSWTIPSSIVPGQYVVFVAGSTAISDTSNGPFTVSSGNVSASMLNTIQTQLEALRQILLNLR